MIAMNLRLLDLNLLVASDALLTKLHVTRAAARIGLSQPGMSNALVRLRRGLKDEILMRTTNGMEPIPRALEFIGPLPAGTSRDRLANPATNAALVSALSDEPRTGM
jgi:hypothetical protein